MFRQTQQKRYIGIMLTNLGHVESARRDYAEALARFEEGRRVLEEIGDRRSLAYALMGIAAVRMAQSEGEAGRRTLGRAYALLDEIGVPPTPWQIARGLAEERVAATGSGD
jgi:hypothetical protein